MSKHGHSFRPAAGRLALGLALLVTAVLALGGCATLPGTRPAAVTVSEIVQMSKQGTPGYKIIRKMRASGTVYRLTASQLARLKRQGVPDAVINYMQRTYLDAVRRDQKWADESNWVLGTDGYYYGGYPFGWPSWPYDTP